jgi:stage II sporulation protein D
MQSKKALLPAACGLLAIMAAGVLLYVGRRDSSAGAGRRVAASLPSDGTPLVGTEDHPLDRVVVWLAKVSGRRELSARGAEPCRLLDGETGEKIGGFPSGTRLALVAEPGTGRVIVRGRAWAKGPRGRAISVPFERRRAALRLVPEGEAGIRLGSARYAGELIFRASDDRLSVVNAIDLEDYLAGVVPGEVPNTFAPEAQKAVAVAARTYAVGTRGRHPAAGADLCDGPHCQNYVGILPWAPVGKRVVAQTRGLIAWHQGVPIRTFYSADCGGCTSNNEDVPFSDNPREPLPYLRSVCDRPSGHGPDYCAKSAHHHWVRDLPAAALEARLNAREATRVGRLLDARFIQYDVAGRVKRVRLTGLLRPAPVDGVPFIGPPAPVSHEVDGWEFRRALGWRTLKSTLVRVQRLGRDKYRFTGRGFGHGVGLCQIGAHGMASPPYDCSFRQILAHYYPGSILAPLAHRVGRAEPDLRLTHR